MEKTSEVIGNQLVEEFAAAMIAAAATENFKKAGERLKEVVDVISTRKSRVAELDSLIAENLLAIRHAAPAVIRGLSTQRTGLSKEREEIGEELKDLETILLPAVSKEEGEAKMSLDVAATLIIAHRKKAIDEEILELYRLRIAPLVEAWKSSCSKMCSGYRVLYGSYPNLDNFDDCARLLSAAVTKRPTPEVIESAAPAREEAKVSKEPPTPERRFGVSQRIIGGGAERIIR